jgi:hypothetical protein
MSAKETDHDQSGDDNSSGDEDEESVSPVITASDLIVSYLFCF